MTMHKLITVWLLLFSLLFAAENVHVNEGPEQASLTASNQILWFVHDQNPDEAMEVHLTSDLAEGSSDVRFQVELFSNSREKMVFKAPADGYFSFTIPAEYVSEHMVLACSDIKSPVEDIKKVDRSEHLEKAKVALEVQQNSARQCPLVVYTKDHHMGNSRISMMAVRVDNLSYEELEDLKVRYYFSVEESDDIPIVVDYYTPLSKLSLLRVKGTNEYALELDYGGTVIAPGESTEGVIGNQVQVHYAEYGDMVKANDFSNPIPIELTTQEESSEYVVNNKVSVYSKSGELIGGMEHPNYRREEFQKVKR